VLSSCPPCFCCSMPRAVFIEAGFDAGLRPVRSLARHRHVASRAWHARTALVGIPALAEPAPGSILMTLADPSGIVTQQARHRVVLSQGTQTGRFCSQPAFTYAGAGAASRIGETRPVASATPFPPHADDRSRRDRAHDARLYWAL
jgi:hypothetical protein